MTRAPIRIPRLIRSTARIAVLAVVSSTLGCATVSAAAAATGTKVVRYHGYALRVPAGWPVVRLAREPGACVRFDRHAVYLGVPALAQRCPAHAAGRTEAVLVEPLAAGAAYLPSPSAARLLDRRAGVAVTATWRAHPAVIVRALRVGSLASIAGAARTASVARSAARPPSGAAAQAGDIYTGPGFDACAAPSPAQMTAWGASQYRAIGVYIGGTNMACSQSNLTAAWVSQQSAAGWHLIPTYVGLQAPTNSCGCAGITPRNAAAQGAAAATDAITQAQALGLGPGNPIYFDMEAYPQGGSNTTAVLTFLASWTTQLHASSYVSGVYSSADSGIADLAAKLGTSYQEPDDLWIARWNGAQNTAEPNLPSGAWATHQRLHQYSGSHNEKYGGATLNIDGDYLDGATAGSGGGTPPPDAAPTLSVTPGPDGTLELYPSWSGVSTVSAWQIVAGPDPSTLAPAANPVSAGVKPPIPIHSAYPYFAVQALDGTGQVLGSSSPVATPAYVAIFGRSAFVSSHGTGSVPVGCFNSSPCHVTTTITVGRTVLASTGPEHIPVGGGLAYFTLTPSARSALAHAPGRRLAVTIAVRDVTGLTAARQLALVPFTTSGAGPRRGVNQSADMWIVGATDFVSNGWVGGILVACVASAPCHPTVAITAAGQTIAGSSQQFLGVGQLGYVFFSLTPTGHRLLAQSRGNQLGVKVAVSANGSSATASIALVAFR